MHTLDWADVEALCAHWDYYQAAVSKHLLQQELLMPKALKRKCGSRHLLWSCITKNERPAYQDSMCSIMCDLVICLVPVGQPQVIVLNLEIQVWEDELQG